MAIVNNWLNKLWQDQKGQDMTEYALISGLVASMTVALVPDMIEVALHIVSTFQNVAQIAMRAGGLE